MNINYYINALISYAEVKNLIGKPDRIYSANKIIDILGVDSFHEEEAKEDNVTEILDKILDYAVSKGIIENTITQRDLLDTKIMDCVMPRPSEVVKCFEEKYNEDPRKATEYFYELSKDCQYIRTERVNKNIVFSTDSKYGKIDVTINLSKPEKDPKDIAAAKSIQVSNYPQCLLCYENVGYAGNMFHPARQNLRIIPLTLNNEEWFMQYSPYVYFNEHCIVFNKIHKPMKISRETFAKLLDFTDFLPHYFLGSNADLPIVGGSILSHDHYQGGNYKFAMADAKIICDFDIKGFEDVRVSLLNWPLEVLRLCSDNKQKILELADIILEKFKNYSDEDIKLISSTDGIPHNTITPIARKRDGKYELDLVLRNNRIDIDHPFGIFHADESLHNFKKENIGLIEVMGLAVLPARLKTEIEQIADILCGKGNINELDKEPLQKHKNWALSLAEKYGKLSSDNAFTILYDEVANAFVKVLESCGVFKYGDKIKSAQKFINTLN